MLPGVSVNSSENAASLCGYVVYQPVFNLWTSRRVLTYILGYPCKPMKNITFVEMQEIHTRVIRVSYACCDDSHPGAMREAADRASRNKLAQTQRFDMADRLSRCSTLHGVVCRTQC